MEVYLVPSRVVANVGLNALVDKRQFRAPQVEGLQGPLPDSRSTRVSWPASDMVFCPRNNTYNINSSTTALNAHL
jgi:hypothetical protein